MCIMGAIPDLPARAGRLATTLAALDQELDWRVLGDFYCHEGGEHFFPREQRDAIRDCGLAIAGDLGEHLAPAGTSLYVGAALAELAPILFEALVLDRRVHWVQLAGEETEELGRALGQVDPDLPRPAAEPMWPDGPVDHLWVVSVLTDPEAFPALHDELYGRAGQDLATGQGDLEDDHRRAEALVTAALDRVVPPATLSTTDEEAPLFQTACRERGWRCTYAAQGRLSGIVGDVVRHAQLKF
jgi:hypothetical protein